MDVEGYVRRKVKPIFDAVLKEAPKNRVLVGERGFSGRYAFYQPHNCRVYFDYVRPVKPSWGGLVVVKNSSELMFKDFFMGCRVVIKRSQIEIINKIDVDRRYVVDMRSSEAVVSGILASKVKECLVVLRALIGRFGGSSEFKVLNLSVQDNKVESESFVDSIDSRVRFRNVVVKKVYGVSNVEFSDPVFAVNYLSNQAALSEPFDVVVWCERNIGCLVDVFRLGGVVRVMSFDNRLFVSNWLFERFGGGLL